MIGPRRIRIGAGFTLIEILVGVSILVLLAAVGVQQLLRARVTADQQLALTSLRHVAKSCQFFFLVNQRFPTDLNDLGTQTSNPPYLTPDLIGDGTSVTKQGYLFTYTAGGGGTSFTLLTDPQTPGVTGERHFYIDQNMIIHVNQTGPAGPTDPVIP